MIIRSDCRGEGRKTSAPKRAISKRDAPIDIISIAQQAKPKVMGQIEFLRTQFTALSSVVSTTPSCSALPPKASRSMAQRALRIAGRDYPNAPCRPEFRYTAFGFNTFHGAPIVQAHLFDATAPARDAAKPVKSGACVRRLLRQ